jgi:hypothetical protein
VSFPTSPFLFLKESELPDGSEVMNKRYDPNNPKSYDGAMMNYARAAEQSVIDHLERNPQLLVIDVRDDEQARKDEIDLILFSLPTGKEVKVEIKADSHVSEDGNVLFEVERRYRSGFVRDGWGKFSKADLWCYINPEQGKMFICRPDDLREVWRKQEGCLRRVVIPSDQEKQTVCDLIPFWFVSSLFCSVALQNK